MSEQKQSKVTEWKICSDLGANGQILHVRHGVRSEICAGDEAICGVYGADPIHRDEEADAYACLIAAAPDLLERCIAMVEFCDGMREVLLRDTMASKQVKMIRMMQADIQVAIDKAESTP